MRSVMCALISTLALACAGCHPANPGETGGDSQARPDPRVLDVTGRSHAPLNDPSHRAALILFITTDCPISNSYAPEIERITRDYGPRGVAVYLVHADPQVSPAAARDHAAGYRLSATVLLDPDQRLAKAVGATVTPEAAIVSPTGELLYRGRIDNGYAGYGKKRDVVTERNVRDALDAVLAGRPVAAPRTEAIGCYIPAP